MFHKLAHTTARRLRRHRVSRARREQAVDRLVAAYVDWREELIAARDTYSRCKMTRGHTARHAFAAYFAALDREERAAAEYAACVEQVCALGSPNRDSNASGPGRCASVEANSRATSGTVSRGAS
jgi:hypothetical protein